MDRDAFREARASKNCLTDCQELAAQGESCSEMFGGMVFLALLGA